MLTGAEHASEALDCIQISHQLIARGHRRTASDVLWLGVKHAISVIAIATGQDYGKYQHKRSVIRRLADETNNAELNDSLKVAMRIHADADQGFLSTLELVLRQQQTLDFVERLLAISNVTSDH
ncbi:MAG: hypothetical protein OXF79_17560 [Chloroflexi bacterium]|nr:hypothetical protein [Chloroflexota bacterium]